MTCVKGWFAFLIVVAVLVRIDQPREGDRGSSALLSGAHLSAGDARVRVMYMNMSECLGERDRCMTDPFGFAMRFSGL